MSPEHKQWLDAAAAAASAPGSMLPAIPKDLALVPKMPNPKYADLTGVGIAALVLVSILLISKYAKGFVANISVLLGIVIGGVVATSMGLMNFDKVAKAEWFGLVMPFQFGMPVFDPMLILTMTLVMIVVMIESTGMFLALGEMTDRHVDQQALSRGLRTDGLGTFIGGIFNTFPYTSFSQNVGLGGRHRCEEPLCVCGRRHHLDRVGCDSQNGRFGGVTAHRGVGWRRLGDVWHGGRHRHSHLGGRGFQEQSLQQFGGGDFDWYRHDSFDRT